MGEGFSFQVKGLPLIKFQDEDKIKSLQSGKVQFTRDYTG